MTRVFKINDVAGIHNLHGMPGLLGGIAGAILASQAEPEVYGYEGYVYNSSLRNGPKGRVRCV